MENPRITVIVPVYNYVARLADALRSILDQSWQPVEILVVDDGSEEPIQQAVDPFLPHIRFLRKEHGGVSSARNHALRHATGDFIAFLDSDDIYLPNKFADQAGFLVANQQHRAVYSPYYIEHPSRKGRALDRTPGVRGDVFAALFRAPFMITNSILARRECFDTLGGFNENYSTLEDYDLFLRLARKYSVGFTPRPVCVYRQRDTGGGDQAPLYEHYLGFVDRWAAEAPELAARRGLLAKRRARLWFGLAKAHLRAGRTEDARRAARESLRLHWNLKVWDFARRAKRAGGTT